MTSRYSTTSTAYSPLPSPAYQKTCMSAAAKRYKYLRRVFRLSQMDFEAAFWQMFHLFVDPQKVFRDFVYRKHTKFQYSRDDPAFFVLLLCWMTLSAVVFAIILNYSFGGFVLFLLSLIFLDCIGCGVIVSTCLWFVVNRRLRRPNCLDQDVEWGYAFDVHLNAFFPPLIILHIFQLFYYYLFHDAIGHTWFIGLFLGNTMWLAAIGYYVYITFLGYSCISIVKDARYILSPLPLLGLLYVISLLFGPNMCSSFIAFYQFRFG